MQENEVKYRSVDEMKRVIEAVLFASGDPISYERLAVVLGLIPSEVKNICRETAKEYDERGISLLCFDTACQLCTKEKYEVEIKDALGIRKNGALSNSSLEALAIIAYNQPVTRAYVEQVRGVDSSYAFNVLLQRELIEVKGKLEVPGRPNLYATTKDFLRVFGLNSLEDLPEITLMSPDGTPEVEPGEQITMNID